MPDERFLASSLNPDAGRHTVTTSPRAIAAAEAATRRSFEEFPYYEARYGERGRAFGLSDGAWLARLCELPQTDAEEQIRWLGRVLAARGMPQIMLERHLRFLYDELGHRTLKRGADDLRQMRLAAIAEDRSEAIVRAFEQGSGNAVRNFGPLIVSAAADEKNGIVNALRSLEEWATDASRFDAKWIEAVRDAIRRAS